MPSVPLTPTQIDQIKTILRVYKQDLRRLVKKHKQAVIQAVGEMDSVKAKKIKRAIEAV